jgi:hypothetical protein
MLADREQKAVRLLLRVARAMPMGQQVHEACFGAPGTGFDVPAATNEGNTGCVLGSTCNAADNVGVGGPTIAGCEGRRRNHNESSINRGRDGRS